jgi:PTH1 family peptidyl-tRNA hydrolase
MGKTIIIAGLGNPGENYCLTPHNFGFLALDKLAATLEFPPFEMKTDGLLTSEAEVGKTLVVLAKPQSFMNNSGREVAKILAKKKLGNKKSYPNLWVINDDVDLPFGKIRIAKNRGSAGHKGVQSLIDHLKTKNFIRFRLGVRKPELAEKRIAADKFVLKKFSQNDKALLETTLEKTAKAVIVALNQNLEKAMTEFNK